MNSVATGYKINIQKSLVFLYIKNEKSEREMKEKSHSPSQQKKKRNT